MYCLIVCPECGMPLADVFDLFMAMRKTRIVSALQEDFEDIDPIYLNIYDIPDLNLGDILDDLCLNCTCCRAHMTAQVEFRELL